MIPVPMPKTTHCILMVLLLLSVVLGGCGAFKKIGSDFVSGASSQAEGLSQNFVKGIRDELANPETKKQVAHFADSIITALNNSLNPKVQGLVGTVINHKVILWTDSLVEVLTGKTLQLNAKNLQHILVGKSKDDVIEIRNSFEQLFQEILSENTTNKIGKMRDELLGAKTDSAVSRIVDHATKKFIDRYKSDLNPTLKGDVSFVSQHAIALLVVVGLIAFVIIALIWWNKNHYVKMVTLLTKHINKIPDQKIYDELTGKIQDESISAGLEPDLRKILNANGLLGSNRSNK